MGHDDEGKTAGGDEPTIDAEEIKLLCNMLEKEDFFEVDGQQVTLETIVLGGLMTYEYAISLMREPLGDFFVPFTGASSLEKAKVAAGKTGTKKVQTAASEISPKVSDRNQGRKGLKYGKHKKVELCRESVQTVLMILEIGKSKKIATKLRKGLHEPVYRAKRHTKKALRQLLALSKKTGVVTGPVVARMEEMLSRLESTGMGRGLHHDKTAANALITMMCEVKMFEKKILSCLKTKKPGTRGLYRRTSSKEILELSICKFVKIRAAVWTQVDEILRDAGFLELVEEAQANN